MRRNSCKACESLEYGVKTRIAIPHTCNKVINYNKELIYVIDLERHLICSPYSIENLHIMADRLYINRCHYSYRNPKTGNIHPHYDIPVYRQKEIENKCKIITSKELLTIIKNHMKITSELKNLVIEEATKLKEHLHADEKAKLNIETFDPSLPHGCIYGQTAGECHSTRAKHLLNTCATPYTSNIEVYVDPHEDNFHNRQLFKLGNKDVYSALEFTIYNNQHLKHSIIPFLKGESDSLEF